MMNNCRQCLQTLFASLVLHCGLIVQSSVCFSAAEGVVPESGTHLDSEARRLSIAQAIEGAMKASPDLTEKVLEVESAELTYLDARDEFFVPKVSLEATSAADLSVSRVHAPSTASTLASRANGAPTSALSLVLGSYTIYNFGKDKLVFDSARETWLRAQDSLQDVRRTIRFEVIVKYWALDAWSKKLKAVDRSIEVARSIRDLKSSRALLGKATEAEVSSAESDLLTVRNERESTESSYRSALFDLNVIVGDPAGTEYVLTENLSHLPIQVTEELLFQTYLEKAPAMKAARTNLRNAELTYEIEKRNLLPLPKVTFSGITVSRALDPWSAATNTFTDLSGNQNLNVSASLNFSIPLTGPGGLLGSRTLRQAQLTLRTSELQFRNQARRDRQQVLQFTQNIRQLERTVQNDLLNLGASLEVLESVVDQVMGAAEVSRLETRDALERARQSELSLADSVLNHLVQKTELASFIGVDFLPRMNGSEAKPRETR